MSKRKTIGGFTSYPDPDDGYKSPSGATSEEHILNVTNTDNEKDMYGNPVVKQNGCEGDKFGPFSEFGPVLDPAQDENANAGSFFPDGRYHCDTCGTDVSIEELAKPSHLGHSMVYGDGKKNFDVKDVGRKGGDYEIGWKVEPSEGSYALKPLETVPNLVSELEASPNLLDGNVDDRTVPM